ncbi:Acetylcholine receptor protein subunit delta precursor, putative [Pediculus humanus corporis]|uniref:pH-sensitive chloride channel 2 n=1 Tax=Pediculus humanus subsp. corporis TaxID=121224 RepID=E0VPG3_PEDHC|nr:Acetylcholine receptor protein subunit delta precursor, putative [Pediculus humanus corporis]EEB15269.1 Acetylcholine receptor protein subunit delta precursor, putative [Pediculus humanus corporis]
MNSNAHMLLQEAVKCGYDKWTRPGSTTEPLQVHTRIYVYFLGSIEAHFLQFTAHLLVRLRWKDPRLAYGQMAPKVDRIVGEAMLKNKIWVPHVYLVNENESKMMGADQQDVLVTVRPDGTIYFSRRVKVTLFCLMNLQKFPFDKQECPLVLESWTYNTSELVLKWEPKDPVIINKDLHLTEYKLIKTWENSSVVSYENSDFEEDEVEEYKIFLIFSFSNFPAGNYSSLTVKFQLEREIGHYIMDFYVPSILLVVVSWVSFWLDPNAVPGRTTLGTSTMLTFITLTRNTGSSLPKVSYIKATEIWFLVCTAFIFGSLVEFAFVNTIWRRKQNVALKKVNSKHILKSTLTPQLHRKQLNNYIERCQSWPSVVDENDKGKDNVFYLRDSSRNELTVNSIESINMEAFRSNNQSAETVDTTTSNKLCDSNCQNIVIPIPTVTSSPTNNQQTKGLTTMTPQEIADWIDRRSRILFPASFFIFNAFYWGFVWI